MPAPQREDAPSVGGQQALRGRIAATTDLTPGERGVAEFYLDSWPGSAFLALAAVSQASGVSTATVTRFAHRIGFDDFRALSAWLKGHARMELEHPDDRRRRLEGSTHSPLQLAFARAGHDLRASLESLDPTEFDRAAALVGDAGRPLILAAVASGQPLMEHAGLLLSYLRDGVQVLQGVDRWAHQLAGLDARSVVLAAAYDRDPIPVSGLLQLTRASGATSVLVTNRPTSPLLALADVRLVLTTERGAMFGSRVATVCVLEALVDSVSRAAGVHTDRAEAIERAFTALGIHSG